MDDLEDISTLEDLVRDVDEFFIHCPDLSTTGARLSESDLNRLKMCLKVENLTPFNLYIQELYNDGGMTALSEFFGQDVRPERAILHEVNHDK